MPVLNEADNLRDTLQHLNLSADEELIIADGGSTDDTLAIAGRFTDRVFETGTGRAKAMNFGAGKARGDVLLFLHADCVLPDNGFTLIRKALSNGHIAAGAFLLGIAHPGFGFRLIESAANMRSRMTSLIYGDQGLFLRKEVFDRLGGFADIPLMEDIEISRRLKKEGKIIFIKPPIRASPRRWLKEGMVYTTLRDWTIAFSYTFFKMSPERLIKHYKEVR
jgi:rSAM/selenodomain-associated transferase 2